MPLFRDPRAHRLPSRAQQARALRHPHPAGLAAELRPPPPTQACSPECPTGQKEATSLGATSQRKGGASLEQQGCRRPWEEGAGEGRGRHCSEKWGGPARLLPGSNNHRDPRPRARPGQPLERWASGCPRLPPAPSPRSTWPRSRGHDLKHRPARLGTLVLLSGPAQPHSPREIFPHTASLEPSARPPASWAAPKLPALDPSSLEGGSKGLVWCLCVLARRTRVSSNTRAHARGGCLQGCPLPTSLTQPGQESPVGGA